MVKVHFEEISVSTRDRVGVYDITEEVEGIVRKSEVRNGLCVVHSVHSTTAVIVNENESGLKQDIIKKVRQDYPRGAGWLHDRIDDNAEAHLASSFIGPTRIFPIREGRIIRGPWQNIFLLEMDGPRTRRVTVEVMGE